MPSDSRDVRKEIIEQRVAAHRDPESGAGLPRPEASSRLEHPDSRRFRITDRVLLKYGFSSNCNGCEKHAVGEKRVHSEDYRLGSREQWLKMTSTGAWSSEKS